MSPNSGKISIWNVTKMAGAWISFCIGSAFAVGINMVQIYCPHGIKGYAILLIATLIYIYFAVSFIRLGFDEKCKGPMEIFEYYCGPYLGKAFRYMTIVFLFLSPTCMIAGFGATLSEYINVSPYVGSLIMGALCFFTVILGLRKLVNICGVVGPLMIVMSLLIGIIALVTHIDGLAEGIRIAPTIETLKYNDSWFISALLCPAWAPLILGPFLVSCCSTVNNKKEGILGGVLGAVAFAVATGVMFTAYFCQYSDIVHQSVPNLYLVLQISSGLTLFFVALVFLGIYSSAVPSQFNFCANFFPENSKGYKWTAVISILLATVVSSVVPFAVFYNKIYIFFSYGSWIFIACMVIKDVRLLLSKKNEKAQASD